MLIRQRLEEQEWAVLHAAAAKSSEAKRQVEEAACPFRTAFQQDRDRILHSKAFRRLKQKTQVYITPGDHFRTRMTHSLEVAQIARTITRALALNEDLTEAIALGHDVGHTPFGHAGEMTLQELTGHFYHNEQSLRVVDFFGRENRGLNLTDAVRDGILNHTGPGIPKTLEGRIVKIADRMAYLCHDYDDGLRAGFLQQGDLPQLVCEVLGERPSSMITAMVTDMVFMSHECEDIRQSPKVREAMDAFRQFMFEKVYFSDQLAEDRKKARLVVKSLRELFLETPELLSEEYQLQAQRWGVEQATVDYIAGLTDSYAIRLFQRHFIPAM